MLIFREEILRFHAKYIVVLKLPESVKNYNMANAKSREEVRDVIGKQVMQPFVKGLDPCLVSTGGKRSGLNKLQNAQEMISRWFYQCRCNGSNRKRTVMRLQEDGNWAAQPGNERKKEKKEDLIRPCPGCITVALKVLKKGKTYCKGEAAAMILGQYDVPPRKPIPQDIFFLDIDQVFDHSHPITAPFALNNHNLLAELKALGGIFQGPGFNGTMFPTELADGAPDTSQIGAPGSSEGPSRPQTLLLHGRTESSTSGPNALSPKSQEQAKQLVASLKRLAENVEEELLNPDLSAKGKKDVARNGMSLIRALQESLRVAKRRADLGIFGETLQHASRGALESVKRLKPSTSTAIQQLTDSAKRSKDSM